MATLSGLLSVFGSSLSKTAPPKPSNSGLWRDAESVSFSPPVTLPDGTSVVYELSLRYSARFEIQRLPSVLTFEVAKFRLYLWLSSVVLPGSFLTSWSALCPEILTQWELLPLTGHFSKGCLGTRQNFQLGSSWKYHLPVPAWNWRSEKVHRLRKLNTPVRQSRNIKSPNTWLRYSLLNQSDRTKFWNFSNSSFLELRYL